MQKKIIIIIIVVLIVLCILPFFFKESTNNNISISSNIISSISSIITLFIAIILYNKYGIAKSIIEKQTEAVLNLLSILKKTRFLLYRGEGHIIQIFLDMIDNDLYKEYGDEKIDFNFSYVNGLKGIGEIAENIFLPIEIVQSIRPVLMQSLSTNNESKGYIHVTIPGYSEKDEKDFFGILNQKNITLNDFIKQWNQIINISLNWLEKYSNNSLQLNFSRR